MSTSQDVNSASRYLESQVTTASQPQLQIMLLDGAVRFALQARRLWQDESDWPAAESLLLKATDILAALTQSAADGRTDVSKRIEEEYAFLFRELVAVRLNKDLAKFDAALELLQYERETWRQACEQLRGPDVAAAAPPAKAARETRTPDGGFPNRRAFGAAANLEAGLSIEA